MTFDWTNVPLVDLHSHVLPGIDDGAPDDAAAIEMLRIADADGVRVIAATPHAEMIDEPNEIIEGVERLNQLATDDGLTIEVVPGSEVGLAADLLQSYQAGRLLTINATNYLLIELSHMAEWPPFLRTAIYELQVAGLTPILAHAERYPAVQTDPGILVDVIATGVLIQINAGSLLGQMGSRAHQTAETLVSCRMAHIVASDAHRPRRNAPRLSAALEHAVSLAGAAYIDSMCETAVAVLRGLPITVPDPSLPAEKSWLTRLQERVRGQ